MSFLPKTVRGGTKVKGRPRGRPKGWLKRPKEEQDLTTIKITRSLWEMLEHEKREKYPKDRLTDILSRILQERAQRIKELTDEIKQLKQTMEKWREENAFIPTE